MRFQRVFSRGAAMTAMVASAALIALTSCSLVQKADPMERMAERLLGATRPDLVSISHWPAAPWPGEEIQARAAFAGLPEGAVVKAVWRGIAGGIAGQTGQLTLDADKQPDPFTGETVCRGVLSTGLRSGDALAYRIEVSVPGRAKPWVSYDEPVLVSPTGSEFRAMWVDSWAPGMFTAEQCRQLVADARKANLNGICIEIRRRGDAFYNSSIEPKNPSIKPASFDPLAEIIRLAHDTSGGKARIEVHGWFVIYPAGTGETAKKHPEWATRMRDGSEALNQVVFDPGRPDVENYLVKVVADCVSKYDLDGVNYDYVRYMESERKPKAKALALYRTEKNLAADAKVNLRSEEWRGWVKEQPDGAVYDTLPTGYNPLSVERFNQLHHRAKGSLPEPGDPVWKKWKCDQVTAFVRKCGVQVASIRPGCEVSCDSIGFGGIKTWATSAPMNAVFQDWTGWLNHHYIDANFHMGYKREHIEEQKKDYRNWTRFMVDNDGGRFQIVGQGSFLNPPEAYRNQVEFARSLRAPGIIDYCYSRLAPKDANVGRDQWIDWARKTVFPKPVAPPEPAWKKYPQTGIIHGTLQLSDGSALDTVRVILATPMGVPPGNLIGTDVSTYTDGTGFFAFTRVPPGEYAVIAIDHEGKIYKSPEVKVAAGKVVQAF